jgi:hypothetical protein
MNKHDIRKVFNESALVDCISYSGNLVSITKPNPDNIQIEDICMGLSRASRYNGQLRVNYNVAQHTTLVADLLLYFPTLWGSERRTSKSMDTLQRYALLHDAAEAYTGDITKNIKEAIKKKTSVLEDLENALDEAVHEKFGMQFPLDKKTKRVLKAADHAAFFIEVNSFATPAQRDRGLVNVVADFIRAKGINPDFFDTHKIKCINSSMAKSALQNRMRLCFGQG